MRKVIFIAAALFPAGSTAAPLAEPPAPLPPALPQRVDVEAPRDCQRTGYHMIDQWNGVPTKPKIHGQKLGELPPGTGFLAVFRTDQKGCLRPVIVRQNVGEVDERPGPDAR